MGGRARAPRSCTVSYGASSALYGPEETRAIVGAVKSRPWHTRTHARTHARMIYRFSQTSHSQNPPAWSTRRQKSWKISLPSLSPPLSLPPRGSCAPCANTRSATFDGFAWIVKPRFRYPSNRLHNFPRD